MTEMTEMDWNILSLWCSKRLDTHDIARQLGLKESEVAGRLSRAREAQRETARLAAGM